MLLHSDKCTASELLVYKDWFTTNDPPNKATRKLYQSVWRWLRGDPGAYAPLRPTLEQAKVLIANQGPIECSNVERLQACDALCTYCKEHKLRIPHTLASWRSLYIRADGKISSPKQSTIDKWVAQVTEQILED